MLFTLRYITLRFPKATQGSSYYSRCFIGSQQCHFLFPVWLFFNRALFSSHGELQVWIFHYRTNRHMTRKNRCYYKWWLMHGWRKTPLNTWPYSQIQCYITLDGMVLANHWTRTYPAKIHPSVVVPYRILSLIASFLYRIIKPLHKMGLSDRSGILAERETKLEHQYGRRPDDPLAIVNGQRR